MVANPNPTLEPEVAALCLLVMSRGLNAKQHDDKQSSAAITSAAGILAQIACHTPCPKSAAASLTVVQIGAIGGLVLDSDMPDNAKGWIMSQLAPLQQAALKRENPEKAKEIGQLQNLVDKLAGPIADAIRAAMEAEEKPSKPRYGIDPSNN